MPRRLHIDFETFSKVDLRDVGAYRYAYDPSTEILCAAMAVDDREPVGWLPNMRCDRRLMEWYWDQLEDPSVEIWAHNAMFEAAIMQALLWKTWGIRCPDLRRFRCTMSLARRAALPGKLETLAEVLGLKHLKDKRGKQLINKFSVMQKGARVSKKNPDGGQPHRILPADEPEAFAEFMAYCLQDVRVEQEVHHKLAFFDEPINNASYSLDAVINARGVTVNLSALRHAQRLIGEETEIVSAKFRELTGFEVTQNEVLLKWINQSKRFSFENLQAETVDSFLDGWEGIPGDECWDEVLALRMKQSIAYTSIKKVATMLECAGPHDNRIRGMLNHHGATTGRWTASLVQFQNMKRSTIADSAGAYRMICEGCSCDELELCYGPVLEVISSCIRHFVHDCEELEWEGDALPEYCVGGTVFNPLLDADYSAIEARIVCWLAGQEDALDRFRAYDMAETDEEKRILEPYRIMASVIYGIPTLEINRFPQRFVGKESTLGCGFGLGGDRFRVTCRKRGYELPQGLEFTAVKAWRRKHDRVVKFWDILDDAAKSAILHKGQSFEAGAHISFECRDIGGMPFLLMTLPSGRKLAYPQPKIVPGRFEGTTAVSFYANIKNKLWGHMSVWGGVWAENATQAVAADIMVNGTQKAEDAGYEVATLIHDQALAYHQPGQTPEEFVRLLTALPAWAKGLPVEAEGSLVPFYGKD